MDPKKLTIHVNIDNMTLPIPVTGSEEEAIIRKAAANVNQQLITVRERYKKVPDKRYYDAMVMLNSETKALTAENRNDTQPVFDALDELKKDIEELINQ